jgi:hypothetical protein
MSAVPLKNTPSSETDEGPALRVMTSRRVAILLFNLGGPDTQEAVKPFLFNLFNDKAIISLPQPFRFFLAKLISGSREKLAKANYALMGGGSPIVPETVKQAQALLEAVGYRSGRASARMARNGRRSATALSAVFHDHDGLIAESLHRHLRPPRFGDLLLSRRRRLRGSAC